MRLVTDRSSAIDPKRRFVLAHPTTQRVELWSLDGFRLLARGEVATREGVRVAYLAVPLDLDEGAYILRFPGRGDRPVAITRGEPDPDPDAKADAYRFRVEWYGLDSLIPTRSPRRSVESWAEREARNGNEIADGGRATRGVRSLVRFASWCLHLGRVHG
jgi:hypothetical protein